MASQTPLVGDLKTEATQGIRLHSVDHLQKPAAEGELRVLSAASTAQDAPLGPLSNFKGTFHGRGFNIIFRPNNGPPPGTNFPKPVNPAPPATPNENVLQLNLTTETLTFREPLGEVPNRGLFTQSDIFLNGVPYQQEINDVTNPATGKADRTPVGIHFENGLWMHVPATKSPSAPE